MTRVKPMSRVVSASSSVTVGLLAWRVVSAELNLDHHCVGNNGVEEAWSDALILIGWCR
jgi:hypothetical protein